MRILVCTGLFPPEIGGPATYSKLLLEELPKKGIDIDILAFKSVRHLPRLVRHFFYLIKILKCGKSAQIIFALDPVSVGLPALLAAKILRRKLILRIAGDYAWEQLQNKSRAFVSVEDFQKNKYDFITQIRRTIERTVAKRADKIIVPSFFLKKVVQLWGIDDKKIEVILNAVEVLDINIRKGEAKDELKLNNGDIIFSAGRLLPWKGFERLIDLMPELIEINPNFKLIIAGDGEDFYIYQEKIKDHKLENKVFLTGKLEKNLLYKYLRATDIFILNSGYEGLSHLIIEAMLIGAPIIASNIGGNPELIKNNETGLLIEYNNNEDIKNAIVKLWHNRQLANTLSENTKKEAENKFKKSRMIDEVHNFFNNL